MGTNLLPQQIRNLDDPEGRFRLSRLAWAEVATNSHPGNSLVANLVLASLARQLDGEPITEAMWDEAKEVLQNVACFIEDPSIETLDGIATSFREFQQLRSS